MVSSSAPTPRSGVYYFSQGWKLIGLPGIRRYVFLPLLVNVLLMGGCLLVAVYPSRQLDPLADEPCAGLAAVAKLPAVAGGSALNPAGVWLLLFDRSPTG